MVDDARLGGDRLAVQVLDRRDRRVADDRVVAGRVVVDDDDHLVAADGDAEHRVVQRLGVDVELAGRQRVELTRCSRRSNVSSTSRPTCVEDARLLGDGQREPARPGRVADLDRVDLRGSGSSGRRAGWIARRVGRRRRVGGRVGSRRRRRVSGRRRRRVGCCGCGRVGSVVVAAARSGDQQQDRDHRSASCRRSVHAHPSSREAQVGRAST